MKNRIVILGAGQSGVGAAILGKKKGYEVFVSDIKEIDQDLQDFLNQEGIEWESGKHSINTIKKRSAFLYVKEKGKFIRSNSFNIQILKDNDLNDKILVG